MLNTIIYIDENNEEQEVIGELREYLPEEPLVFVGSLYVVLFVGHDVNHTFPVNKSGATFTRKSGPAVPGVTLSSGGQLYGVPTQRGMYVQTLTTTLGAESVDFGATVIVLPSGFPEYH